MSSPSTVDQQSRQLDRVLLESNPKRKIPSISKKRVMPACFTNFVEDRCACQPARKHFCDGTSARTVLALLAAEKVSLKLIHARVREQQRRIVGGQERRRTHTACARAPQNTSKKLREFRYQSSLV
jgi:hypothetical protein